MEVALDQIVWRDRRGQRVRLAVAGGVITARPWRRGFRDWIRWASGKSNYLISELLNQIFSATAYSFPGTLYMALWTSSLSAASTGSTSGEASYTGYARVTVTASGTNFTTSSAGSNVQNKTAITFPTNAGTLQTVTYFAILDASSSGNILYWGSITSTAINPLDTPQVNIDNLTVTEA